MIDDRVPCGPDGEPIFCSSSDPLEAWPLLLEKAVYYLIYYLKVTYNNWHNDTN